MYIRNIALAFLATTSMSFAEIALASEPINAPVEAFDWSGFYVGVQGGYALMDAGIYNNFDGLGNIYESSTDLKGLFGGLHAGYNYQSPSNFVFGVEVDANIGDHSKTGVAETENGLPYALYTDNYDVKAFGSARLRVGLASGDFMPYLTAGLAVADLEVGFQDTFGGGYFTEGQKLARGYTVGGGFEYALSEALRIRAEYRYSDYGTTNVGLPPTLNIGPQTYEVDLESHNLSMGLSYAF